MARPDMTSVYPASLGGYDPLALPRRRGRATSSPTQFGQVWLTAAVHTEQDVHS